MKEPNRQQKVGSSFLLLFDAFPPCIQRLYTNTWGTLPIHAVSGGGGGGGQVYITFCVAQTLQKLRDGVPNLHGT
jgi:hypothetical protein